MKFFIWTSLIVIFSCRIRLAQGLIVKAPTVSTPLGTIEGFFGITSQLNPYESYLGIPYAEAITPEQRFEVAKPAKSWTGIRYAKTFGPSCMQVESRNTISQSPRVTGSEDCLYLNVYVHTTAPTGGSEVNPTPKPLLPVIIFIHGGLFQTGSSSQYGAEYLMNKPVVLVTINYRLGAFGFLSTEDDAVPGNMGLKDQVMAIRWVKDYIRYFNGDPERITLIGHEAGGASVHLHYFTKVTKGLFQRGMSMSGNALDSWAQTESSLEKAKKLATILACPSDNVKNMINCLKTRTAEDITRATAQLTIWVNAPPVPFGPVVEYGRSNSKLIYQAPIDSIVSGEVHDLPWVTSEVSEPGLAAASLFIGNAERLKELNDNWEKIIPSLLDFIYTIPVSQHNVISKLIREHYFGKKPISGSTISQIISMIGDRWFKSRTEKAVRLQAGATKSSVRLYYFSYRGEHSTSETFLGPSKNYGVTHYDYLAYVLKSFFDPTTTQQDQQIQKVLINLWFFYATEGLQNIGSQWPPFRPDSNNLEFYEIASLDDIGLKESSNFGDKDFWESIKFNENISTR